MTDPYVHDPDFTLHVGDALDVLQGLPSESVHMCVTSPPFFGLRDYGTGVWEGGDPDCDHTPDAPEPIAYDNGQGEAYTSNNQNWNKKGRQFQGETCPKCGARRVDRQIGLEASPDEWVARLVQVFREVRRVLRKDGTLWLEIGDSYASGGWGDPSPSSTITGGKNRTGGSTGQRARVNGLKPKDLVGAPWLLAFALRADGWYLRSDIIWARPNPMPESVRDRPTKSHSYVFLLSKSGSSTYWTHPERAGVRSKPAPDYRWFHPETNEMSLTPVEGWRRRNLWQGHDYFFDQEAVREDATWDRWSSKQTTPKYEGRAREKGSSLGREWTEDELERYRNGGRNIRSVWTIPTEPLPDEHYAAYPSKLVERCILAGSSERGCCPECGAPWERVTNATYDAQGRTTNGPRSTARRHESPGRDVRMVKDVKTTGWKPICECWTHDAQAPEPSRSRLPKPPAPCVVLDPFLGSGTTALVARRLGRHTIGIELSTTYAAMAARRLQQLSLLA